MTRRRIAALLFSAFLLALLVSCSSGSVDHPDSTGAGTKETDSGRLKIVTTIFPQYDFARQIAGGNADVVMLLKPGEEAHSFEPTPQDIRRIQNADLFIYVGGENDVWVRRVLNALDHKPDTIKLIDTVSVKTEKNLEGMQETPGETGGAEADEHVWTSPKNAIRITRAISRKMQEKDPEHAESYRKNTRRYIRKLRALDERFRRIVRTSKRKTLLFGDRFPFRYFADEYGLTCYAAYPGCSENAEVSAKTLTFLSDKIKEEHLPYVLKIELSSDNIQRALCEATGAKPLTFYSCHNVTADQLKAGETYLSLMEKNAKTLKKALN
ncbi:MAG: metal ABC transporter substrate-binding protein [Anaerovoracaceae bacterium]